MHVRAGLIVGGLIAAAFLLWDGEKVQQMVTDEPPPGQARIGDVVRKQLDSQLEIQRLIEEIRRNDAEIQRLRVQLGNVERTYSQPQL
jgi:hypothetical protein